MGVFCARTADAHQGPFGSAVNSVGAFTSLVRIAAALGFALAVLILLGWAWDLTLLKSVLPGQRATQPLSAVCFGVSALALALSTERCVLCRFL